MAKTGVFLELTSESVKTLGSNGAALFTVKSGIVLPKNTRVSLNYISLWNAIHNVTALLGTNTLFYYKDLVDFGIGIGARKTITVQEGIYTFDELREAFTKKVIANGDFFLDGIIEVPFFEIVTNFNTQKVEVKINSDGAHVIFDNTSTFYGIDVTVAPFGIYTNGVNPVPHQIPATNLADATNGLKTIMLRIPGLVKNSFLNDDQQSFLYRFEPNVPPGSSFFFRPVNLEWLEVGFEGPIKSLIVQLTDQNGTQLVMAGGKANPVHVTLQFQPMQTEQIKQL
jgi:hypothetical protein